jgi:signal peptidase I
VGRWVAIALLVAAGYATLAPRTLGGSATYVTVDGTSMVPTLRPGDLVILREAETYEPGDVIAFHSRMLDRVVIHRIIDVAGGRFVTRGDGNDWTDADRPVEADILGERWLRFPGAGRLLGWLQQPWIAALSAAAIAFLLWGGRDRDDVVERLDPNATDGATS